MSSKLHGLVWEGCAHAGLILSRVAVMARLADYSNDEGLSWPAVETIQRQIGAKSKTTVSAAIDELERDGWLTKTERKSGGRNLSNIYQINVEKLELAADTARKANKAKKQSTRTIPPIIDPSNITPPTVEGLTVDPSNIDPPIVEGATIGQNTPVKGSIVGPDPSLNSKHDPSLNSKPSCQVAAQPDDPDQDPAMRVLEHFNRVTGSSYGKGGRTKTTLGYIRGRLAEDYSAEDLMLVVDYLTAKWRGDSKMDDYLRPSTLFGPDNCVEYFDKATKWCKRGRPKCVNGRWQLNGTADSGFRATYADVDYSLPENSGFRTS